MSDIAVIDVIVPPPIVIDIASVGVAGPPGADGAQGIQGEQGEPGPPGTAGLHAVTHQAGGADALSGTVALTALTTTQSIAVGTNPAQSGAVRLGNNQAIVARNAANTANITVCATDATNNTIFGSSAFPTYVNSSAGIVFQPSGGNYNIDTNGVYPAANNTKMVGHPNVRFATLNLGTAINLKETAAPAADCANLWIEDNGSGKSRLMVQFATGAAIAIATQA